MTTPHLRWRTACPLPECPAFVGYTSRRSAHYADTMLDYLTLSAIDCHSVILTSGESAVVAIGLALEEAAKHVKIGMSSRCHTSQESAFHDRKNGRVWCFNHEELGGCMKSSGGNAPDAHIASNRKGILHE